MQLGSGHQADGVTPVPAGTDRPVGAASSTRADGAPPRPEVEVVRPDPWPRRLLVRWQRSGRAEGKRSEVHPVRGALLVAAVVALAWWLPGAAVFLGILSAIVVVHECGHLVVARACGMRPTEFFLGFGPTVWSRTSASGVRYGVKAALLGGFVKIPGMGPAEEVEGSLEPYTYRAASRPRRLAVILAGVTANFLLAVVLFTGFAMWSPAGQLPEQFHLEHAADGRVGPVDAVTGSVVFMREVTVETLTGLGDLVTGAPSYATSVASGSVPKERMVSAVGGAQLTDGLLSEPKRLLLLAGLFSTSIAVFNLLPLLPLDGGHAAIVLAEGAWAQLRGRPRYRLDPNRFRVVAAVVIVALLLLGISSMYVDILHPVAASG